MDSIQIIKYSLMSKILNDSTTTQLFTNNLYLGIAVFIYLLYQIIPQLLPQNVKDNWTDTIWRYNIA